MHANGGKTVLTKKAHSSRIFTDRLYCKASASQNFDSSLAGSVAATQQKKRFNDDERGQLPYIRSLMAMCSRCACHQGRKEVPRSLVDTRKKTTRISKQPQNMQQPPHL